MTRILIGTILVCISFFSQACDVCGASNSITGFGTYANGNRTNFGLNYQYKTYRSSHPALFNEPKETSSELFQRIELKVQLRISKRWQGSVVLPFALNQQNKGNLKLRKSGLNDLTLGINYFVMNLQDSLSNMFFRWNVGLGTKLPTGAFTHPDSSDLMLYAGSGTFDPFFSNTLFYQQSKWSVVSETSFYLRGINKYKFQPGNTFNSTLFANRKFEKFSVFSGFQFTWVGQAYRERTLIEASPTVGQIFSAILGLTYRKDSLLIQGAYHIPLYQHLGNGYTQQKQAFNISLFYFI